MGIRKVWVFTGPKDDKNCPDCRKALEGGPYPPGGAPVPGKLACGDKCRHSIREQNIWVEDTAMPAAGSQSAESKDSLLKKLASRLFPGQKK